MADNLRAEPGTAHRTRTPIRRSCAILIALTGCILWSAAGTRPSFAFQNIPYTLTLRNGMSVEGFPFPIDSVSRSIGRVPDAKRIQVVDTGPSLVMFSQKLIPPFAENRVEGKADNFSISVWQKTYSESDHDIGRIVSYGEFNEFGHRQYLFQGRDGKIVNFVQGITRITPDFCDLETILIPRKVDKRKLRRWPMSIATSSVPFDVLRDVMHQSVTDPNDHLEYVRCVDLFFKAGLYAEALEEENWLLNRFPDLRKDPDHQVRVDLLRQAATRDTIREVRTRLNAGQPDFAFSLADVVNPEQIAGDIRAELDEIKNEITSQQELIDVTRKKVNEFIAGQIATGNLDDAVLESARQLQTEMETDLDPYNLARLDSFTRLANDQSLDNETKLSLAISGWLIGSNNAIRNLPVSAGMFPVRRIVREYLNTLPDDKGKRTDLLSQLSAYDASQPEYLSQIIARMKPPKHELRTANYTGEKPIEFFVNVPHPVDGTEAIRCLAHLPPEYSPYKRYPCIVTLRPGINTEAQLDRWCGSFNPDLLGGIRTGRATRHGYVVVSIDWKRQNQTVYQYSAREHAAVLRGYREALRSFAIDSDRVFLTGHSIGATAAYDIGVSHPEHWAGIIGFGGNLAKYPDQYRANKHIPLGMYVVMGEADFGAIEASAGALNQWMQSGKYLECMLTLMKGRCEPTYNRAGPTAEEYSETMPDVFRWMAATRRISINRDDFEMECKILRPWDNYFWFWELNGLPEGSMLRPEHWRNRTPQNKIELSARLTNNKFVLGPANRGESGTLSLSPDFVNFDEPIRITGRGDYNSHVVPSKIVLLEDVRRRGDRQHPFWAKLVCEGKRWSVAKE